MLRNTFVFLLGFTFGVATLTTFRHEVQLSSRTETLFILVVAGVLYVGLTVTWLKRLQMHDPKTHNHPIEWSQFIWTTLVLLFVDLTLVIVFLVA